MEGKKWKRSGEVEEKQQRRREVEENKWKREAKDVENGLQKWLILLILILLKDQLREIFQEKCASRAQESSATKF